LNAELKNDLTKCMSICKIIIKKGGVDAD